MGLSARMIRADWRDQCLISLDVKVLTLAIGLPLVVSLSSYLFKSFNDPFVNSMPSAGMTALAEQKEPPARTQHLQKHMRKASCLGTENWNEPQLHLPEERSEDMIDIVEMGEIVEGSQEKAGSKPENCPESYDSQMPILHFRKLTSASCYHPSLIL